MMQVGPRVDPRFAMINAAEDFAFSAALLSISITAISVAAWLVFRRDLRSSALAIAPQCVHPAWFLSNATVWYDDGATLMLASRIWIAFAFIGLFAAMQSVYRNRTKPRKRLKLQITTRGLLVLTFVTAIILVFASPSISDQIPVSQSVAAFGMICMLVIYFYPTAIERRIKRAVRVRLRDGFGTDQRAECGGGSKRTSDEIG